MTRYYKKEEVKVETVTKYKITKMRCDYCNELITKGTAYFSVTEYPEYPEDGWDATHLHIHKQCLSDYVKNNWNSHIEILADTFRPHEVRSIDTWEDEEDIDE